jgi:hypothetical protein
MNSLRGVYICTLFTQYCLVQKVKTAKKARSQKETTSGIIFFGANTSLRNSLNQISTVMKRKTFLGLIPAGIGMLSVPLSCIEEEPRVKKGTVTIRPLTDEKIKAEIRSMVQGEYKIVSGGRTLCCTGLPPCYDYENMDAVTISGTNWVTYVAYSTEVNTSTRKKSVGLYYQSGVFKNWLYNDHQKSIINGRERHTVRYLINEGYPGNWTQGIVYMDDGSVTTILNKGVIQQCGDTTLECVIHFYEEEGWISLGLIVASAFTWGVPVAMVGSCLVTTCFLGWHTPQQGECGS